MRTWHVIKTILILLFFEGVIIAILCDPMRIRNLFIFPAIIIVSAHLCRQEADYFINTARVPKARNKLLIVLLASYFLCMFLPIISSISNDRLEISIIYAGHAILILCVILTLPDQTPANNKVCHMWREWRSYR